MRDSDRRSEFPAAHSRSLHARWWARACVAFALCAAVAIALPAQTFQSLHSFDGTDGAVPLAGLVRAADGNLYGTTNQGGANVNSSRCYPQDAGCGTVFKITASGTLTTLYNFCSLPNCADGANPAAGLIQASDGNFYGTTYQGGVNGQGTAFRITPSGVLTTIYNFCSQSGCADGDGPKAGLIQAGDGSLYGTTFGGGVNDLYCSMFAYGCGTVFKLTLSGALTTLYTFTCPIEACTDGFQPAASLIQASDGNLYGTTSQGGDYYDGENTLGGTVFKVTPSGTLTTLYSFCKLSGCTDGQNPQAGLAQGTNGSLYGTTFLGGPGCSPDGCGTAFRLTSGGALTTVAEFDGQGYGNPLAPLLQASDGNFYGATSGGNGGVVFEVKPNGGLTLVYGFDGPQGIAPAAPLIQDTNGRLYGTTSDGGIYQCGGGYCGTVFDVSVGLGPFVETEPTSGAVGRAVKILGTNLTGTTSVTFNRTPAVFTVVSRSLIAATVPAGATTGTVQVALPGGTLTSNVPFRVRP